MPEDVDALVVSAVRHRLSAGPLTMAELIEELGVDEDDIYGALDATGDESVAPLLDDRWVDVPTVLAGRLFTHRVDADEVAHDLLTEEPDLEAILFLPMAHRRLSSGELHSLLPGMDQPTERRSVPPEAVAAAGSLVLPSGVLAAAGVEAGDYIGLEVTPTGLRLSRVDPVDLGDAQPEQAAIARVLAADEPTDLGLALITACADAPDAFRQPVVPLTDLVAEAGLSCSGGFLAPAGFDIEAHQANVRKADLVETYELSESEAFAVLVLLDHSGGRVAQEAEEVAAAVRLLAEPAVADAVMRSTLFGRSETATPLVGLVDELWPLAGRSVRPALQWLRARAYEWRGDVLEAEQALQAAERLDPDWPMTLLDLARYASDRGDAVRGLALLRRADPYEDPELEGLLEHFQPVAGPVVGRNDPCWCGSGRKFKQCHLHRPAERPLTERARWLWNKGRRYLEDGVWPFGVEAVTAERVAYAEDDDTFAGGPDDPLVADAVLFEGGAFAEFLAVRGDLLPTDERLLAEQWLLVDRSVFEVTAVQRGEGATLRDLRTGDIHEVQERTGSTTLRPGQLICARVVPAGDTVQIFGGMEPVRLQDRDELLALLDDDPEPEELVEFVSRRFAPPTVVLSERAQRLLDAAETDEPAELVELDDAGVREAMTAYMADYERNWLDTKVPALRGLTPRQAATDPTRREDLVQLLSTFPDTNDPTAMSAGRLRAALGLDA